ncbi:MAG: M23 family metallopeptidase [Thermotogota bacterium]|nr:M23 family metallopeptidase [Thermotogota bacterium]
MKKTVTLIVFLIFSLSIITASVLSDPLNIELLVTGYFGEYRSTFSSDLNISEHFHKGIDLSTNSRVGLEVFAPESGYVDSLMINHPLYGTALILTLPAVKDFVTNERGIKILFGHLQDLGSITNASGRQLNKIFNELLLDYGSSYIQVKFPENEIAFNKGEMIAYSGNTGNVDPHLHVEIRDLEETMVLNPGMYFELPEYSDTTVKVFEIISGGNVYDITKYPNPLVKISPYTPFLLRTRVESRQPISPKTISIYVEDSLIYRIDFSYFFIENSDLVHEIYTNSTMRDYRYRLDATAPEEIVTINKWQTVDLSSEKNARLEVIDHWGNRIEVKFRLIERR